MLNDIRTVPFLIRRELIGFYNDLRKPAEAARVFEKFKIKPISQQKKYRTCMASRPGPTKDNRSAPDQ